MITAVVHDYQTFRANFDRLITAPRTATEQEYKKGVSIIRQSSDFNLSFFNKMGTRTENHSLSNLTNLRVEIKMTLPEIAQGLKFVIARSIEDQQVVFKINALIGNVPFNSEYTKKLFEALSAKIKEKTQGASTLEGKILDVYQMFLSSDKNALKPSLPQIIKEENN